MKLITCNLALLIGTILLVFGACKPKRSEFRRIEVGKNGQILTEDSHALTGIKWVDECREGPIKVTTLHEINAAEIKSGVNLFDSANANEIAARKEYLHTLRTWAAKLPDEQTRACYTFWLDRAEEGNLTPVNIEKIPGAQ